MPMCLYMFIVCVYTKHIRLCHFLKPKDARPAGRSTPAAHHRSGVRTPRGANFHLWVKKSPSLCSPQGLALSCMGQGSGDFSAVILLGASGFDHRVLKLQPANRFIFLLKI